MPLLSALLVKLLGGIYGLAIAMFGAKWGVRLTAISALATLYIACAATFSGMIAPWLAAVVSTPYGQVLGLLFPPVSGTVVAAVLSFWACILAKRYSAKLIKMTIT